MSCKENTLKKSSAWLWPRRLINFSLLLYVASFKHLSLYFSYIYKKLIELINACLKARVLAHIKTYY